MEKTVFDSYVAASINAYRQMLIYDFELFPGFEKLATEIFFS